MTPYSYICLVCVCADSEAFAILSLPSSGWIMTVSAEPWWLASTKGVLLHTHPDKHLVCDTLDKIWVGGKRTELDETGPSSLLNQLAELLGKIWGCHTRSLHSKPGRWHTTVLEILYNLAHCLRNTKFMVWDTVKRCPPDSKFKKLLHRRLRMNA